MDEAFFCVDGMFSCIVEGNNVAARGKWRMEQDQAPLLEKLLEHRQAQNVSAHVPGHKSGKGVQKTASLLQEVMSIDLTEISGMDDLHDPEGVILEAQRLAASCFGAEETFFLVNGSTAGNLSAILTLCSPGDILIVQRDVHKSVVNGLMLAGAKAVFVPPVIDPVSGLPSGVDPVLLEKALERYPEAKGVFVTNPNYYGLSADLANIVQLAHAFGVPVAVDEAHGAHFGFHPDLPPSAMACGADLAVQSTHKMLTALTMGAMLHVQGRQIDRERLRTCLSMLQSSSPSYPIMASLDASRRLLATEGSLWIGRSLQAVREAEDGIEQLAGFETYRRRRANPRPFVDQDPYKLILRDATGTLGGFALQRELEQRGIFPEMADDRYVLLVFSIASDLSDAERLLGALVDISQHFRLSERYEDETRQNRDMEQARRERLHSVFAADISEPVSFGMEQLRKMRQEEAVLGQAAGRKAAEMVVPYPPGIPVLYPGETIAPETAEYLRRLALSGARFQGAADPALRTIRVLPETDSLK